jgi:hypothetical protein
MSDDDLGHHNGARGLVVPDLSGAIPTSSEARAKHRIAALEEELQVMKQERGMKQRFVNHPAHYMPLANRSSKKDYLLRFSRPGSPPHGRPLY